MAIYLDNHATTPCDPRVVEAMLPFFTEIYGNPSSSIHEAGKKAARAVDSARQQVASLINADPKEIIFTSGATESNNLAIMGLVNGNKSKRRRIVTTPIEHKSILEVCKETKIYGYEIQFLKIDKMGLVDLDFAREIINQDTLLVSVQAANNEIGTIQNVRTLVNIAHNEGAFFHTDAAQAVGKIPVSAYNWDFDLLSISSHKLYGPKGVGSLFVRPDVSLKPIIRGGGQELNIRSGTLNVSGIVGLGMACQICSSLMDEEEIRIALLRDVLEEKLLNGIRNLKINGAIDYRLPGNSSITFPGIDAEALIVNLPELDLSVGSACSTGALEPSYVLTSIGLSRGDAYSTLRVGLGRFTTMEEIQTASDLIINAYNRLIDIEN